MFRSGCCSEGLKSGAGRRVGGINICCLALCKGGSLVGHEVFCLPGNGETFVEIDLEYDAVKGATKGHTLPNEISGSDCQLTANNPIYSHLFIYTLPAY